MNRCGDCERYDTSMARQVTPPPPSSPALDPSRYQRPGCPPEDANIICRPKRPPRRMPSDENPTHVTHAVPPQQYGYRCLSSVPKEVLEDPDSWCRCCKKEANIDAPCGEEVTHSVKLVYELPKPKFGDQSITQQDYHSHPMQKREIPPWHPCKTEFWSRPDVPCVSETTYQRDFLPPPTTRQDKKSVLLMPKEDDSKPTCQAIPCYRDICEEEPFTWDVYRKTEQRETPKDDVETRLRQQDQGTGDSYCCKGRLVRPADYPKHGLSLCEGEGEQRSAYWWKTSSYQPEVRLLNRADAPEFKSVFRDETTYDKDFQEPPPVQRNPEEFHPMEKYKRNLASKLDEVATTTHKDHYKPPKLLKPEAPQPPRPRDTRECNPCYWANRQPEHPDCWTGRTFQDPESRTNQLAGREYMTNLQDLKLDARNSKFDSSNQFSRTSDGDRAWMSRSVLA